MHPTLHSSLSKDAVLALPILSRLDLPCMSCRTSHQGMPEYTFHGKVD